MTITGNTFWMGYEHNLTRCELGAHRRRAERLSTQSEYDYGDATTTKNAIFFRDCNDCTLTGLHVHGVRGVPAAVAIEKCRRFNVTTARFSIAKGLRFLLKDVTNSRVSDCLIRYDLLGAKGVKSIVVEGGSGNLFANNVFANGSDDPEGVQESVSGEMRSELASRAP